jgi:Uma2 family endonuclease
MSEAAPLERIKWRVADFHKMVETGVLSEDDRVELIDGEMIEMAPIGRRHLAKVNRLSRILGLAVGERAIVSTQNPIALPPRNEPQPDIALLRPHPDDYESGLPTAADVLLVIEVADTTLAYDRDVKMPIYARYGIAEAWLFDVEARVLFVHHDPAPSGYRRILTPGKTETVSPLLLPQLNIDLAEVWR